MSKLHEILAISSSLEGQAEKVTSELRDTFTKKHHLFGCKITSFESTDENIPSMVEEQSDLQTTVTNELKWIQPFITKAIDTGHQINCANQKAQAAVILDDGSTLTPEIPATTLLELEKRLAKLQLLLTSVPTLDPAKGFTKDLSRGSDVFVARETTKTRTAKRNRVITLAPATEHHPAQTQLVAEDHPVGLIKTKEWSGMITPSQKAEMLGRVEQLLRAVKRARSRANDVEVDTDTNRIGVKLLNFILGD